MMHTCAKVLRREHLFLAMGAPEPETASIDGDRADKTVTGRHEQRRVSLEVQAHA